MLLMKYCRYFSSYPMTADNMHGRVLPNREQYIIKFKNSQLSKISVQFIIRNCQLVRPTELPFDCFKDVDLKSDKQVTGVQN